MISRWKTGGVVMVIFFVLMAAPPAGAQKMEGMKPMGGMKGMKPMSGMKGMKPMGGMGTMGGMPSPPNAPVVPAVMGYSEGKTILFIHTETSDRKIAKLLTDMMGGSPVLVVPSLAKTPKALRARVYVFTNGAKPRGAMGPLGFQPDVFENPPGSPGYSPLREIVMVTWKNPASSRILKSADKVEEAVKNGDVKTEESGIVVNMPMLTWPGGSR